MALMVSTREIDGVTVLVLGGDADNDLMVDVVAGIEAVAGDGRCVVLDVDDLWLVDVAGVRGFLTRLHDGPVAGHLLFSCGRLSGRRVLRRWGGEELPVFSTPIEAAAACRERRRTALTVDPAG